MTQLFTGKYNYKLAGFRIPALSPDPKFINTITPFHRPFSAFCRVKDTFYQIVLARTLMKN